MYFFEKTPGIFHFVREGQQLGFLTLKGNLAISAWVGLVYDC